jgi:N-acyl-D-amino-acid deacylase
MANVALGQQPNPRYPWRSLGEYFAFLENKGTAINLGTYVGTSSVREAVMGDATRHPTVDEMRKMGALIDSAMRDGAFGVGTGLIYLPSAFFSTDELIELTKYATPYKGGYAAHIRNEGNGLVEAVRETIRIAAGANTWAEIRHLKSRSPALMQQAVALIDSARRAGIDITADQYPYIASGTSLQAMLNTWVQEGGDDSLIVEGVRLLSSPKAPPRLAVLCLQTVTEGKCNTQSHLSLCG